MFREVKNRRSMLFILGGIGSMALLWRWLGNSDASAKPADNSPMPIRVVQLEVACADNQLAFNPASLTAPAAAPVRLVFHNVSTIFMHNWVLVNRNEGAVDQVLQSAMSAGIEHDYLPQDMSNVIAHTRLVPSGGSATITFTAPSVAGEYTYICTFPGHCLAGMKGTFVVKAKQKRQRAPPRLSFG